MGQHDKALTQVWLQDLCPRPPWTAWVSRCHCVGTLPDQLSKTSRTSFSARPEGLVALKDLPLQLESSRLAPRFIRPVEVGSNVNPWAVQLKLPSCLKVSNIPCASAEAGCESDLVPPPEPPTPMLSPARCTPSDDSH